MASRTGKWQALVVVLLVVSVSHAILFFDCRRQSITCANSGTCGSNGLCTGCTGFEGYDCLLPTAQINENDCGGGTVCLNSATCYDLGFDNNNAAVSCYCTDEYTGAVCDTKRFTVTCTNTQMDISITPYSTATAVYGEDKKGSCDLTESSGVWTRTSILHTSDSACGSAVIDTGSSPNTYTRSFVVQDLSDKLTNVDYLVTAVCQEDNAVGTATIAAFDVSTYLGEFVSQTEFGGVTVTSVSPSTTTLGEEVTFTFTGTSHLEEIRLDLVDASDNQSGGLTDTLITSGCRVSGKEALVVTNPAHPGADKTIVEVKLRLFLFNSGSSLKLTFTFKTCLTGNTVDCAAVTCSSRRKRDVYMTKTVNNTSAVDVVFFPKDDLFKHKDESRHQCADADCNGIILPTVLAGAALFVGVLALGLMLIFIKRRRDKQQTEKKTSVSTNKGPVCVTRY
ncbi:uncharacterized protein LOC121385313 [Gigantopelta aegis]|uniref:uncharacterized protein LOC121385313 n=1 Tax=Gigantopelta aegis TaxID=1735272 RepID=UPI001B887AFD|nr:uncharacterized protein LOC121385313 [Gigantopelta aegis]XP_041371881.1 uncharacterized protein LOC121385313 [Gigantopelta aegis]